ncbi:MAG TPA: hypothetical protein VNS55_01370 [Nocardioides sp.]|nr:hypothetical protein [Nocardioides sp.]
MTARWAASAAVIAAMTAGAGAAIDDDDQPDQSDVASAFADPPDEL